MAKQSNSFSVEEIKQKIIAYCVYQDRSHYLVEQKLSEFLLIQEAKDEIVSFLIKEKYLDEERFVRSFVHGKFYQKKWGKKKIKQELYPHKIVDRLLQKAFDEEINLVDYKNTIQKLIQKKQNERKSKKQIYTYLIQKGYTMDEFAEFFD